jgi:DNA-binding GntR family transcriptional regulator
MIKQVSDPVAVTQVNRGRALTASAKVYNGLREQILSGELDTGSWLVEAPLAEQFGVSRTPVREALRRLADDRLVSIDTYRGAVVRGIEAQEAIEIGEIHEVHDGLAARLAAQRAVPAGIAELGKLTAVMRERLEAGDWDAAVAANVHFHAMIYELAGNSRLSSLARDMSQTMRRFSAGALADPQRALQIVAEHERCVEAIAARDQDAAEHAAREHGRACMIWTGSWLHARRATSGRAS